MGYIEQIMKGMKCEKEEVHDVCLTITTKHEVYELSFIEFETRDFLGISSTRKDFTEGFVILNKKYIVSIAVVYQQDIVLDDKDDHRDIQYN